MQNLTVGLMEKIMRRMEKVPRPLLMFVCFLVVLALGVADTYVGPELFFSLFYLMPVVIGAWFIGPKMGALLAVASYIPWLIQDVSLLSTYHQPVLHFWNGIASLGMLLLIAQFSSAMRRALIRERETARVDALTGIANRMAFYEEVLMESMRARRFKRPLTLIYMDVDNFKAVNDLFGHHTGDKLLVLIARTIKEQLRATDTVARLGGDELAVLLPATDVDTARGIILMLQAKLTDVVKKNNWPVSFSIGAATFVSPPASVDEIIKQADALMYVIKNSGGNNIRLEQIEEKRNVRTA